MPTQAASHPSKPTPAGALLAGSAGWLAGLAGLAGWDDWLAGLAGWLGWLGKAIILIF